MAEDKQIDLLKNLIENREVIYNKINEEKEKLIPVVNIINILGNTYYEVSNSSLLYNILKIKFKYDNKEINFAKDFSEFIIKEKLKNDSVNINSSNINVYSEERPSIESRRRMDLFIQSDNFEIIIENKINAGDQEDQLQDYYSNRIKENRTIEDNIFIVYLTRYGYKPSAFSINKKLIEELENKNKICYLSHNDMAKWIEDKILNNKEYQFLKEKEFKLIYSALIQIAYNEKFITKETEENKMEQKITEEFLNLKSLINEGEPVKDSFDKLNKFYELLENAQKVILDKRVKLVSDDIKYSLEVSKFIKNVQTKKGGDYMKGAIFYDKKIIEDIFYSGKPSSQNIEIFLIKNPDHNKSVNICLNQLIYPMEGYKKSLYFGVWIHRYNNNKEILYKKVKEIIEEKFGKNFEEYDELIYDWVSPYIRYIDIEEDKPEEIGQKMIDLYNLLKEKITQ